MRASVNVYSPTFSAAQVVLYRPRRSCGGCELVEEVVRQVLAAVAQPRRQPPGDVGVDRALDVRQPLQDRLERRVAAHDLLHVPTPSAFQVSTAAKVQTQPLSIVNTPRRPVPHITFGAGVTIVPSCLSGRLGVRAVRGRLRLQPPLAGHFPHPLGHHLLLKFVPRKTGGDLDSLKPITTGALTSHNTLFRVSRPQIDHHNAQVPGFVGASANTPDAHLQNPSKSGGMSHQPLKSSRRATVPSSPRLS